MSIEESIKVLDEIAEGFENLSAEVCARNDLRALWAGRAKGIRQAIAVINAHLRVQPNDPLTLEELREMDGEPVWVEDIVFRRDRSCGGLWAIVVLACDEIVFGDRDSMPLKDVVGFAYRRKPEEAAP